MLFVSFLSWWYAEGWRLLERRVIAWVAEILDFFSVSLLARTLFSTYRQISVDRVNGSASVRLHAWADRQISRFIGASIRLVVIIIGLLLALGAACLGIVVMVAWPLVLVLPVFVIIGALIYG